MDNIGSGDIKKDFGYQLTDGADGLLSEISARTPFSTEYVISIDLQEIASTLVSTKIPQNTDTAVNDNSIIKKCKLKYGEIVTDSSVVPCTTTSNLTESTADFYILNSALMSENITKLTEMITTGNGLLHQRPPVWYLAKGQMDWIWHFGEGKVSLKYYDKSNALIGSAINFDFDNTNLYKVNMISLDPYVYSKTNVHKLLIEVKRPNNTTIVESYTVYFRSCCSISSGYVGIMFLEPLGGRASFNTGCVLKTELQRSYDDVFKRFNCLEVLHYEGGASAINLKGMRKRSFKTQLHFAPDDFYSNLRYVENFFSSPGHHVQRGIGGSAFTEKCILSAGTFQTYEKESIVQVEYDVFILRCRKAHTVSRIFL
jgi:hypothetical protein